MEAATSALLPSPLPPKPNLYHHNLLLLLAAAVTLRHLKQLHAHILQSGTADLPASFLSKLLSLPSHSPSSLHYALLVFRRVPDPPTALCNRLLKELSRSPDPRAALLAYQRMQADGVVVDRFSLPPLLRAAARGIGEEGRELHGFVAKVGFESDPFVQTGLIRCYGLRGRVQDARRMFDGMSHRDVVAWGVMFDSYCQAGRYEDILLLFEQMKRCSGLNPDSVVLVSVLVACWRTGNLSFGTEVHSYIVDSGMEIDDHLRSALINMYANCRSMAVAQDLYDEMGYPKNLVASTAMVYGYAKAGEIDVARAIFNAMPEKDLVCWSAMITGYAESDLPSEALALFNEMQELGIKPDRVTMLSVISACGHIGALGHAEWVHNFVDRSGFGETASVNNAIITMYSKCGSLERAWRVFEQMPHRNVISWTGMITGLAMHGDGNAALRLFNRMKDEGIEPNGVTFVGLLYACSHSGLVDDGRQTFDRMVHVHRIEPQLEHYGCMVDLLGRANLLDEVIKLIRTMPFRPNVVIWGSVLGACRVHGNIEFGEFAAKQILELDPNHDGAYVLLSNIYARGRRWEDMREVRKTMKSRGVLKERGRSWIEHGGELHEFAMGNQSHPKSAEVYAKLDEIVETLQHSGYAPDAHSVLVDIEDEEKKVAILLHSEKLAFSFALIGLDKRSCIRIMKNLRVCEDCHSFMKSASSVFEREIVLRDRTRFHHFKYGMCSCKDFW